MIERCTLCGNEHETGDPVVTFNETKMPIKVCPYVEPGTIMFASPLTIRAHEPAFVALTNLAFTCPQCAGRGCSACTERVNTAV